MNPTLLVPLLLGAALTMAYPSPCSSSARSSADGGAEELVNRVGGFAAKAFPFKITLPDDGKDEAGGWQEAATQLEFSDARRGVVQTWTCSFTVGLPVRSKEGGTVTPEQAATAAASAATIASDKVIERRPEWLPTLFCIEFGTQFQLDLNAKRRIFGARVRNVKSP